MGKAKQLILAKTVGAFLNLMSYVYVDKANKLAYRLFSEPRLGKLSKLNLPEILKSAKKETFQLNEHFFETYHWAGNENIILLLHGWESNSGRWEKMIPFLQKNGNTIYAIDAPAHGLSSGKEFNVPLYAEFIDMAVKKFKPSALVGHSIGGIASMYYQDRYPHSLQKMVLLGAPSDFKILLDNYVKLLNLNSGIQQFLHLYTKERFHIILEDFTGQNFLKNTTLNGIIAHDVDDTVVPLSEAKKLTSSWSSCTFIETKGFGHSLHNEELYRQIATFLK